MITINVPSELHHPAAHPLQDRRPANVLIVDDDEAIVAAFVELMKLDGYESLIARSGEEALEKISLVRPELIFMDVTMPKLDGLEALKKIKAQDTTIPVVIITGNGTMHTAISAMKFGAYEYLTKPLDGKTVRQVARRVIESTQNRITVLPNRFQFGMEDGNKYELVGDSLPMQNVFKLIGSIASTPNHTSVLITGESGTGKELAARAIHANSSHASEPFVAINCTVLTESLLESELFGHERGAFTGAVEKKLENLNLRGKGQFFLMRSATSLKTFKRNFSAFCRNASVNGSAGINPLALKPASSPLPTKTFLMK